MLDNLLGDELDVHGESVTASSLPASLAGPAAADLVESASGVRAVIATEGEDERRNVVGLEGLNHLGGHDGSGHSGTGVGGNSVDKDVVLLAFDGKSSGESEDTTFLYRTN